MRKSFVAGLLLLFTISIVAGCSQRVASQDQNLELRISKPEGQGYKVYKTIQDNETIQQVNTALQQVPWENAKVLMSRQPDYKIETLNTDPTLSYETAAYALWLTPQQDRLEVVIEGQSKYGKLSEKDSQQLLSILETP